MGALSLSSRNPNDVLSKSQPTGRFMADKVIKIWDVSKRKTSLSTGYLNLLKLQTQIRGQKYFNIALVLHDK